MKMNTKLNYFALNWCPEKEDARVRGMWKEWRRFQKWDGQAKKKQIYIYIGFCLRRCAPFSPTLSVPSVYFCIIL